MTKVKAEYKGKTVAELKKIYLSTNGWKGENEESRTPFSENGVRFKNTTPMAYQQNGKWVIGTFGKYASHLTGKNITINQNSLTFLKLDEGDGPEEMNAKRTAIVNESSTTGTHTLYQNSFMKNVADYPVDGEYCHKSVYADNSVILMKLKRELLALSLKLSKLERNENDGFAFLDSGEEDESLQPFTNAIIATLGEIGIHQNTTDDNNLLDSNIEYLVGDLFYNIANTTDETKAKAEFSGLSDLIKILLKPTTQEVFTSLSEYTKENQLATGFKEAIDKTKGELHTCYNLFVNEYGDEFTNKSALEQETMMREKSIMYPGATTQAGGYPDILFVGKDNKLVYAAPTKKGMTAASGFEGNQIVRHPLDIFYNMKNCFKIADEDGDAISTFEWSDKNIREFKDHASNSENWLKVSKGEESRVGGEHLAVLKSDQYKKFNLVSNQIFPFPTRSTVDKMFNEAGVTDISSDELGEIYAHIFGKISGYVLATKQTKGNAELMKSMSVANINETKMTFYKMLSKVGVDIETKLKSLFNKFISAASSNDPKLSGPQKDMLIMAGVIIGKKYSELEDINADAGSDLTAMLKGMATEEANAETKGANARADKQKKRGDELEIKTKAYEWATKTDQFDLMRDIPKLIEAYKTAKSKEAQEILKKMQAIYKPNTSKGDLLTSLRGKYNTDTVNQSVKLSDTEELAEYVISMKFAEDMEIKTVQQILESNPLSDVFSQEETRIILTTIGERSNNKGNAQTGSHEPINFKPS